MTTERDFIRSLGQQFPVLAPVRTGIGDDGAVISTDGHNDLVVVTDMLLDGVHFDLHTHSPAAAGRKAVAVNLSDLAAMGCRPTAAFVSIAVPRGMNDAATFLQELYEGIGQILSEYSTTLAGGDTNSWNGPFAINVCLTGSPFQQRSVLRSAARAHQGLYVTGALGGSFPSGRHLTFRPRLAESEWLMAHLPPQAMMDLSDGLSIDAHRLAESSGVGIEIYEEAVPVHNDVPVQISRAERFRAAISDGEDFELLVVLSDEQSMQLKSGAIEPPFPLIEIGRTTEADGLWLMDSSGQRRPLKATGWEHPI